MKEIGICKIVRDIGDTSKVEKDLAANRELFAKIFLTCRDPAAICSAEDLKLLDVNDAFLQILDLSKKETVGNSLSLINKNFCDDVKNFIAGAEQENDTSHDIEITLKRKSGNTLHGLLSVCIVEYSRGRLVLIMLKDISRGKQAEQLLRIQRDLSVAAGAAPGPEEITECILDYALRIEGLDSGAVYTVDESGRHAKLIISAGFSEDFIDSISPLSSSFLYEKTFTSDRPVYLTFKEAALPLDDVRDGRGLEAIALVPIRHENKVIGVLVLASHSRPKISVSAEHTIEAISGMIGGAFARAGAERALRESEEKLRQSEKMQAIGQLAGGVAHDFNNQLMGITGYADLLSMLMKDNPKALQYAKNILLAARRSADLTAQLLAFARKGKYLSVFVDIHKIIQEASELLSHSIDKKIIIRRHLRADPCVTTGDPAQLQNAVLNLALNARDAMVNGGELIFTTDIVEFREPMSWDNPPFDLLPGKYLSIGVSDTGEGMTPEVRRHIFEPFFTTKEQGKGTGMGLAAVFGTIKNHKGAVIVDSAPRKGTSFRIILPLHAPRDKKEEKNICPDTPIFQGVRVLVVDDEEMVLTVAGEMLDYLGCSTRTCRNGREGVRMVQKSPKDFDLVILDMMMPKMGGKDALLRIKKINPSMRVLLASGYSMEKNVFEYASDPSVQFIQKPFRLKELSEKMKKILAFSPKRALQK